MSLVERLSQLTTIDPVDDLKTLAYFFVGNFIFRWIMCHYVLNKIGEALKVKRLFKFTHRSFDMIHYTITWAIGTCGILKRPYGFCIFFAKDCGQYMYQLPEEGFICSYFEKIYFMQFTAYYLVDFFYCYTSSEPVLIFIHHCVSLTMIFACVFLKCPATGLTIMVLHDFVDVPLYIGKIFLYLGFNRVKDVTLVIFAIFCTWFRLTNFPILIYHCLKRAIKNPYRPILYRCTCALLCCLYCLHLIWEKRIWDNFISWIHGTPIHDDRSDNVPDKGADEIYKEKKKKEEEEKEKKEEDEKEKAD